MDLRIVYYILGRLVVAETAIMLIPFFISLYNGEECTAGFAAALAI